MAIGAPASPRRDLYDGTGFSPESARSGFLLPTKKNLREILNELYTNPDYPSAFGGQLKQFILSKDSYSKHRQKRKIFKRRKIFVTGPYVGVQADTINYRNYARYNSGFRYILGNFKINLKIND